MTINRTEELAERTVLLVDSKASSPRVRLASRGSEGGLQFMQTALSIAAKNNE